eukprot:EG_transcript_25124
MGWMRPWLLLSALVLGRLAAAEEGIHFCSECRVFGEAPLCGFNCSECSAGLEYCIPDVQCGGTCWAGSKMACCPKRLFPKAEDLAFGKNRLFSSMVRDNRVYVDGNTFQVVPFSECLWSRFSSLSPFTVHACVIECKFLLSCYADCLGYPSGTVAAEMTVCTLRNSAPPDVLIAADAQQQHQPPPGEQCPYAEDGGASPY